MLSLENLRQQYQREICRRLIYRAPGGIASLADSSSRLSVDISFQLLGFLKFPFSDLSIDNQTIAESFEGITRNFLQQALYSLNQQDPCRWSLFIHNSIADFDEYKHLAVLAELVQTHKELKTALDEYVIQPDIIVARLPLADDEINERQELVRPSELPKFTSLRASNSVGPTLHASISCKWTIRSDRSQNARTEGLNLIRNRKGHTPHIAVITAEPMPTRIASLAMGTGDIDCVYHFALHELVEAVKEVKSEAALETLDMLIEGRRLRDIADLPFDLAI